MGQSYTAEAVILVTAVLVVVLLLASCGLRSWLELKRDRRKARAREREAGEQP